MAYKPNIPQAGDRLSISQIDISNNMGGLNASYAQDHVDLPDTSLNAGSHLRLQFPGTLSSSPATGATEQAMFGMTDSKIHLRQQNNGTSYLMTSGQWVAQGLRLEAWVMFSATLNPMPPAAITVKIFENTVNGVRFMAKSANVLSVVAIDATDMHFQINFSPSLSTAEYFWVLNGYSTFNPVASQYPFQGVPKPGNAATDTATAAFFRCRTDMGTNIGLNVNPYIYTAQFYTVA